MYENWYRARLQLLLVAIIAPIIGCSSGERRINPTQADCVIPVSATVRDICFSPDGDWIVAVTRKIKDREYERSCIAYNIESAQSIEIPQNIDSVCRWGSGFLSTTGQQIFSFSLGAHGALTIREESQLSEFPLHMLGSGRIASNETTIAVAPVWIEKGDGGQAYIPSEKTVFGAGVDAGRLRTALLKLEPKGMDIHCASITSGPKPTVAITYPTSKAWRIAVLTLDADEPTWNTILAGKLPGYHEPLGDEPYDIALRSDGQRVAAVGAEASKLSFLHFRKARLSGRRRVNQEEPTSKLQCCSVAHKQ